MTGFNVRLGAIVLVAAIVAAMAYTLFARKRRPAPPAELTHEPGNVADPARELFAAANEGEAPTEDQIARARAGGLRGAPELGQAPLPRQAREQLPGDIDDGHVA
jgi:hypothetical protein